ncbi:MAG TPA: glycosyltransferase family 39 protein, partial [Acidimicrobiales bacterium]|nr:glycosyltransferase family 39 protein [Acidimicrobiales bacterium]
MAVATSPERSAEDLVLAQPELPKPTGRRGDATRARLAVFLLLALAAGLYTWDLGIMGWANGYYSAAVQAGTKSWEAAFFGSLDPSNFISTDKAPASLWVMEASARIFGLSSWGLLVPEALEGVATVWFTYLTVKRWSGPAAGLVAGGTLALTPIATVMFRFNNPDALMLLTLTVSAYTTTRAVEDGRARWAIATGAVLGAGFLAKMLEAFLVLPALGATYLLAAPGSLWRRARQVITATGALIVSAAWWPLAVWLAPARDRPFIESSQNNSIWSVILGYDGLGRLSGNEPGSVGVPPSGSNRWGVTGLLRLFGPTMGAQISWLLPTALVLLGVGLVITRSRSRQDRSRAALVLWGGWLMVMGTAFSLGQGIIHPYYTMALAPPIGALIAVGGALLWPRRNTGFGKAVLLTCCVLTLTWSFDLLDRIPEWLPELRFAIAFCALILALGSVARWAQSKQPPAWLPALAAAACLAGPAGYSLEAARTVPPGGAVPYATVPTGFPPGDLIGRGGGLLNAADPTTKLVKLLRENANNYRWVA